MLLALLSSPWTTKPLNSVSYIALQACFTNICSRLHKHVSYTAAPQEQVSTVITPSKGLCIQVNFEIQLP